ncbi:MAG: hypothetical protein M3345_02560 [Actinomycetota bacterium]|nr:hypothetical protein [Actinomycetota bacterium]
MLSDDLFQPIVLLLLLLAIVALLLVLSAVNALKRLLEDRGVDTIGNLDARQPTPSGRDDAPLEEQPLAGDTAVAPVVSSTEEPAATSVEQTSGFETEPEEQPFERDGRWYFKRGGELLLYDEGTGQWVPAPGTEVRGAPSASGAQEAAATPSQYLSGLSSSAAAAEEPVAAGTFWKCASCGAVNGTTAASCRMCFAARPS